MGLAIHAGVGEAGNREDEVACVLLASIVSLLFGMIVAVVGVGAASMNQAPKITSGQVVVIVAVSAVTAFGDIAFWYANVITSNLAVNAINYMNPALSLVWLGVFASITLQRSDWLIVGAAVVAAVSILTSFRPEHGPRVLRSA